MRDYQKFYEQISAPLRGRPGAVHALQAVNTLLTLLVFVSYPLLLASVAADGWRSGGAAGALALLLPYLLVPGVGFVLISVIRDRIDEKRPYEAWPIDALIQKDTHGHSMPSRHVFSASVIAMCVLDRNAAAGAFMLLVCIVLSGIRVLGGVHYPRDVLAGFAAGVLAGSLLLIL